MYNDPDDLNFSKKKLHGEKFFSDVTVSTILCLQKSYYICKIYITFANIILRLQKTYYVLHEYNIFTANVFEILDCMFVKTIQIYFWQM